MRGEDGDSREAIETVREAGGGTCSCFMAGFKRLARHMLDPTPATTKSSHLTKATDSDMDALASATTPCGKRAGSLHHSALRASSPPAYSGGDERGLASEAGGVILEEHTGALSP